MNTDHLKEAALWAVALVAIGITIAAGTRIVSWLVQGDTSGIWRAALGLVVAASGGGYAAAALRHRGGDDGEY